MKSVLIKIFEIAFGLIIGLFVFKFSGNDLQNELNALFGLLAGLLSTTILSIYIGNYSTHKKINGLKSDFQDLKELILKSENYKVNLIKLLNAKPVIFEKTDVPQLWLDLLWEINNRCWATTYIHPSEGWEQVYTKIGNDIQKAKIFANDADIRRVFIIDSTDELKFIKTIIKEQNKIGVKSRYIYKTELNDNSFLKSYSKKAKSLDFIVIDDKLVGLVYINKNRIINKAEICKMNRNNEFYVDFYKALFNEASEI